MRRSPKRPCVATGVSHDDTGRARSSSTNSTGSAGLDSVLSLAGLAMRSTMLLQRIASVVEVERAHGDEPGAVDAEPTGDVVARPLQRQLVLACARRSASGTGSRPRSCTPSHGSPLKRHGPIEIGTAGSTTTSPSSVRRTRTWTRSSELRCSLQHDLERVVVAGLERAGLRRRRSSAGPSLLLLLAAQRAEQPVGQLDLDRQALDDDLDAGVGLRDEQRAPAWPACWPGARSRSRGAGAARAAAGPGVGR